MANQTFASIFDALCNTPAEAADMRLRANLMMHITPPFKKTDGRKKKPPNIAACHSHVSTTCFMEKLINFHWMRS